MDPPGGQVVLTPSEQDDLTIKQTEEIQREITSTTPLITPSSVPPLLSPSLLPLYTSDPIYTTKILAIASKYSKIRHTRPDGNCLYRGVLFRLFELALESGEFRAGLEGRYKEWKALLGEAGYTQFTVEDFYDNFGEALATLGAGPVEDGEDSPIFTLFFSSTPTCDYLTVFLRILTAAELVKKSDFYSNFLDRVGMDEFTKLEVEPMGKEADHLQIIALATALDFVGVKVVYMDRGEGSEVVEHCFPEGKESYPLVLLYRPGHYDVVYE